jgi:hypothetical protein
MATHYFTSSWPAILAGVQFSQLHTAYELQSTFSAKGLTDLSKYTITHHIIHCWMIRLSVVQSLLQLGRTKIRVWGKALKYQKIILLQNTISMIKF